MTKFDFSIVRKRIQQEMIKAGTPSFALAVAKNGKILWEEAFGWADLGYGEWGYMSLPEMEAVYAPPFGIIERDCYWDPKPMREVLKERASR